MIELHPRPDALDLLGLPAIPYPVALPAFQSAVANDAELPLVDMLRGLQGRAADPDADWQRLAPAMARLAELIAGSDAPERVEVAGDGWRLDVVASGMKAPLLHLERDGVLLAALGLRADGRLRVCAYQPLDAATIRRLRDLAVDPAAAGSPPAPGAYVPELPANARAPACVAAEIAACLGADILDRGARDPDRPR